MGENAGVLVWIDGQTGKIREPLRKSTFRLKRLASMKLLRDTNWQLLTGGHAEFLTRGLRYLRRTPKNIRSFYSC